MRKAAAAASLALSHLAAAARDALSRSSTEPILGEKAHDLGRRVIAPWQPPSASESSRRRRCAALIARQRPRTLFVIVLALVAAFGGTLAIAHARYQPATSDDSAAAAPVTSRWRGFSLTSLGTPDALRALDSLRSKLSSGGLLRPPSASPSASSSAGPGSENGAGLQGGAFDADALNADLHAQLIELDFDVAAPIGRDERERGRVDRGIIAEMDRSRAQTGDLKEPEATQARQATKDSVNARVLRLVLEPIERAPQRPEPIHGETENQEVKAQDDVPWLGEQKALLPYLGERGWLDWLRASALARSAVLAPFFSSSPPSEVSFSREEATYDRFGSRAFAKHGQDANVWRRAKRVQLTAAPQDVGATITRGGQALAGAYPTSVDRLMFSIVTSVSRARDNADLWLRWLTPPKLHLSPDVPPSSKDGKPSGPACVVLFGPGENRKEVEKLENEWREQQIPCDILTTDEGRYEARVLEMERRMPEHARKLGRDFDWFIWGDDDTFWIDPYTLVRELSRHDPAEPHFLGTETDSLVQRSIFGRMAYGGGGVAASRALVANMERDHAVCKEETRLVFGGDEMLTRCAARASNSTKDAVLEQVAGMHQFDIPDDVTGIMQSGIPFLNVHHYMLNWAWLLGWAPALRTRAQIRLIKRVSEFLGGDNMFRRYVYRDGHELFTNGYSITVYEKPLRPADLSLVEHTWAIFYPVVFKERPHIAERKGPNMFGDPEPGAKQTFYIVRPHTRARCFFH